VVAGQEVGLSQLDRHEKQPFTVAGKMSPFDQLIATATASAPPGAVVWIMGIQLPPHTGAIRPDDVLGTTSYGDSPKIPLAAVQSAGLSPELRLETLRAIKRPLPVKEWATEIKRVCGEAISERELKRALKADALVGAEKGHGKDHKTVVVQPDQMVAYLALRRAVLQGDNEKPFWWEPVMLERES
jgi:hypothetical protein